MVILDCQAKACVCAWVFQCMCVGGKGSGRRFSEGHFGPVRACAVRELAAPCCAMAWDASWWSSWWGSSSSWSWSDTNLEVAGTAGEGSRSGMAGTAGWDSSESQWKWGPNGWEWDYRSSWREGPYGWQRCHVARRERPRAVLRNLR